MHVGQRRPGTPESHPEEHHDVTPDLVIVHVAHVVQRHVKHHPMLVTDKDPAAVHALHEGPLFTESSSRGSGCRGVLGALALAPLAEPGSPVGAVGAVVLPVIAVAPAPVHQQAAAVVVACTGKRLA